MASAFFLKELTLTHIAPGQMQVLLLLLRVKLCPS